MRNTLRLMVAFPSSITVTRPRATNERVRFAAASAVVTCLVASLSFCYAVRVLE